MFKLLNASFSRLKQNKVFWFIIVITIGIALFFVLNSLKFRDFQEISNELTAMDHALLNYINIVGLFIAMFTSLFIGTEYDYGTIRNKIIVGHSRVSIYFANLIISIVVGIILEIIYMLAIAILGSVLQLKFSLSFSQYLIILLEMICIISAFSSLFTLIALLCSNVTLSTPACMLLLLGMYIVCSNLAYAIDMPEYVTQSYYGENGVEHITGTMVNQNYPSKEKMFIYKTIYYSMPSGQALEISSKANMVDTANLLIYSAGTILVINIIGACAFSKKELK